MAEVDLNKCDTDNCEKCGFQFYKERVIIKRVSGITLGNSFDTYVPVKFYACEKCGTAHKSTKINIVPVSETMKIEK